MRDCISVLEHTDKNVCVVRNVIEKLIELIQRTERPADFFYPAFKHDMLDDLNVLTEKHIKKYWDSTSEPDRVQAFQHIQAELIYSLALLQMTLEQN